MNFAIDPGHGCYPDTGAEGFLNEQNCALTVANLVIQKLKSLNHNAYNIRPPKAYNVTNSLQQRCDNAKNADYLVSIHLNAGGGKGGSEVFAMSRAGYALANKVQNALTDLGFRNRGVKDGSNLYVLRHSKPVAILIEICFVDVKGDSILFNNIGINKIATAIVKGLTGKTASDTQNITSQKGEKKVKNIVIYNNHVDMRAAQYLADYLQCPYIAGNVPFDFSTVEHVYGVGAGEFTSYMEKHIGKDADRWTVIKEVLKFCNKL